MTALGAWPQYCKDETEYHHNEQLIRKAVEQYPDSGPADLSKLVIATKGGSVSN